MTTFALVLTLLFANGSDETFVLDHGLTQEECLTLVVEGPPAYSMRGTVVRYSCEVDPRS